MDPFKKAANIPCLRSKANRSSRSEYELMEAMLKAEKHTIPWMVGPSFETDGRQIKLQLLTTEKAHPGAPGLVKLHKEGYKHVSYEDQTLASVMQQNNGVYRLQHIHAESIDEFNGMTVIPVDPGDAVVAEGAHFPGLDVRAENVVNLMDPELYQRVTYSGELYREKTLTTVSAEKEQMRRGSASPYGMALDTLINERKRTCNLQQFLSYCRAWADVGSSIYNEVLTDIRRIHRFKRFRAIQKTIEEIAEQIAPKSQALAKRIVLFEDGSWKAMKGQAAAPRKKIIRVLCQRVVVVMVVAAWTSSICPGCGGRLRDGNAYRTKTCNSNLVCRLHPHDQPYSEHDRDQVSKTVIAFRGMNCIAGIQRYGDWKPIGL